MHPPRRAFAAYSEIIQKVGDDRLRIFLYHFPQMSGVPITYPLIERLLKERPDVAGISVPGMPVGAPGMEGPNPKEFAVISFDDDGELAVFSTHTP